MTKKCDKCKSESTRSLEKVNDNWTRQTEQHFFYLCEDCYHLWWKIWTELKLKTKANSVAHKEFVKFMRSKNKERVEFT